MHSIIPFWERSPVCKTMRRAESGRGRGLPDGIRVRRKGVVISDGAVCQRRPRHQPAHFPSRCHVTFYFICFKIGVLIDLLNRWKWHETICRGCILKGKQFFLVWVGWSNNNCQSIEIGNVLSRPKLHKAIYYHVLKEKYLIVIFSCT